VFDEVDAGIGGRVAHAVGEKLVGLSAGAQVLCVTHLPQIARLADTHIHVSKAVRSGRTVVSAALLDETERVAELARMLGGAETDDAARGHAEKMLEEAKGVREKLGANQRAG
jgi:DNA repair protein RecN (Recombination protein N)